jgi:SAM-dependent methyltransferase
MRGQTPSCPPSHCRFATVVDMGGGVGDEGLASGYEASPADVAALYDIWAEANYDDDLTSWGYDAPERIAARMAEHLASTTTGGSGVLDAGCGTGRVGVALRNLGITGVIGGDFSGASVDVARSRAVYDDVTHLDLNALLPYADDRFAGVTSVGVFSYLADSGATIRELLRVVAPAGVVVFTQRTDLWLARDFDQLIASLVESQLCTATVSSAFPYLPGHAEFGTDIDVFDTILVKPARPSSHAQFI